MIVVLSKAGKGENYKKMRSTEFNRSRRKPRWLSLSSIAPLGPLLFVASTFAQTAPIIYVQPQSQTVLVGDTVTLFISLEPSGSSTPQSVTSGTLQLWLKADAGVVTNASGRVSQWQDQSGNVDAASQLDTNMQPLLVNPPELGGMPAVRFDGDMDTYLIGTGDVGVSNAMTTFTMVNAFSATNDVNTVWLIGDAATDYGGSRSDDIVEGDRDFSTWHYDYQAPFVVPTNTYRIWTDRVNTNLTTIELFDTSASGSTNFSGAMPTASTPEPGYYIGGIDPFLASGLGAKLDGDVAEWLVYSGYLSEADRLVVQDYLQEKYFPIVVTTGLVFQWRFDGTNIAGATSSTLTLTNVQVNESGSYSVIVTNSYGSVTSSNAVLSIGDAPSVTVSPPSQTVIQGTNVTFIANATGTGPLGFQWYFDGTTLEYATNSALSITNVKAANAGTYVVTVSSPFGKAVSSNAILTIDILLVIETQPQGEAVLEGSTVIFSVAAGAAPPLPSVSSGTLQLWLKANTGVVTNVSGHVVQWHDQSDNKNDASQGNTNNQPLMAYPPGIGGQAAVRFNGITDGVHGDYLHGTGNVDAPNALTVFVVYNAFSTITEFRSVWFVGAPGTYGAGRGYTIYGGLMDFTLWGSDSLTPLVVATNTYRICTDRVNTNLSLAQLYDNSATDETNFTEPVSGAEMPAPGYYMGGMTTNFGYGGYSFSGDIAELIYYSGSLTDPDRLAVLDYLQQKYFEPTDTNGFSYQWKFDGTNIAGATKTSLTLTDVQPAEAGTYSVTVTDVAGSTITSNAILTVLVPATISSSPTSQFVMTGTTVVFTAGATGTIPLNFQWRFDGTNIEGATNSSLTITNAVIANSGSYTMVATNLYGSATSLIAILSVDQSTIQVASASGIEGGTVAVSIDLVAVGTESEVGFSLNFDPSVLTYTGAVLGSNAIGGALEVNSNQVASGSLGLGAALFNSTFAAGTNDVFDVTFQIATVSNATTTSLTFGNQPIGEQVSDPLAQALPAAYLSGVVSISPATLEGDVSPRPNGNGILNLADWVQEARFVAGLDIVSNGNEFQRADCAPRSTLGDGRITVADWVQVGRYVVGLDPLTADGGPTSPQPQIRESGHPGKDSSSPSVTMVPLSQGTENDSIAVDLAGPGNVNALGFSITFDPTTIQFVSASLGSGAQDAALVQNTNQAASGSLGFLVGYLAPATFTAGTQQVVNINFSAVALSNTTALVFSDAPVTRQVVDPTTAILSASYVNAALAPGSVASPTLSINQAGNNVVLSWPSSAAVFELQAASSLDGNWSNIAVTPITIGSNLVLAAPISTNTVFYRLKY